MGCGATTGRSSSTSLSNNVKHEQEDLLLMSLRHSQLQDIVAEDPNQVTIPDDERIGEFSLGYARLLADMSSLVYLEGTYWASSKKGSGNSREGMQGLSVVSRYWVGGLRRVGANPKPNKLGVVALDASYNRDWDDGLGTMRDGLIAYTGRLGRNFVVDTHAMISLRPRTKEVVVTFRGSEFLADTASAIRDIITNACANRTRWSGGEGAVHSGVHAAWTSVKPGVVETVKNLISRDGYTRVFCTGHSLGGGIATLCAAALMEEIPGVYVELYTFGGLAVGNVAFQKYFDRKIVACFRVVHDRDIVPTLLHGSGGYSHVGKLVKITRLGLWVNPEANEVSTAGSQGRWDRFYHHCIGDYQRLLDLFCATTSSYHAAAETIAILKEAWQTYLRSAQQVETVLTCAGSSGQGVMKVRIATPNAKGMSKVLTERLGLSEEQVSLLRSEMLRLSWWYGAKEVDWSVFMIAAYELFFSKDEREKQWRQNCARWYASFSKFDYNGDEFLDKEEFMAMWKHEVLEDGNADIPQVFIQIAEDQFKSLDICMDEKISFAEYALWRDMCDPAKTRKILQETGKLVVQVENKVQTADISGLSGSIPIRDD
eukprot:3322796-Amphidinium_carterae.3